MRELRKRSCSIPADRGAAAVEFALVLPLLMMLVMGGIDWGFYFFQAQVVTNAAREGARAGSLEIDEDGIDNGPLAENIAKSTAETYLTNGLLDPSIAQVIPSAPLGAGTIRVDITYPVFSITGFNWFVFPDNIYATAEMRR